MIFRRPIRRRIRFRRALALLRAWYRVVRSEDPDQITRAAADLARTPLPVGRNSRLLLVPSSIAPYVELCVRQYLLSVILYASLLPGLLLAATGTAAALPVPATWRARARKLGCSVRGAASWIAFARLVLLHWGRGVMTALRLIVGSLRGRLPSAPAGRYHVLCRLPAAMLPKGRNGPADNFALWYAEHILTIHGAGTLWVQTARLADETPAGLTITTAELPRLTGSSAHIAFALKAAWLAAASFGALFIGRWWAALILRDLMQLAYARTTGRHSLARGYAFDNSGWAHRPLFTYWAESAAGSKAQLLFYSTNHDEPLRLGPAPPPPTYLPGYEIMSWSDYIVWDDEQADLIRAFGHRSAAIHTVGPIPLTESGAPLPTLPDRSVAVFDVTPFAPARLAAIGFVPRYYGADIAVDFLDNVQRLLEQHGYAMAFKRKREIGRHAHPRYRRFVDDLTAKPNVYAIDPSVSARRLTAACRAVVCTPFSSPALIARQQGLPVAYYDPTGHLLATDRQTRGLPLLRGTVELRSWLADLDRRG